VQKAKGSCDICSEIYVNGEWPDDILDLLIIPVEKNCGAQDCVDFRTISLVVWYTRV